MPFNIIVMMGALNIAQSGTVEELRNEVKEISGNNFAVRMLPIFTAMIEDMMGRINCNSIAELISYALKEKESLFKTLVDSGVRPQLVDGKYQYVSTAVLEGEFSVVSTGN